MNKKGFTVIELLVVVAIISILAAAAFVNYDKAQAKTRDAKRMSDLNAIAKAYQLYFQDHDSYVVTTGAIITGLNASQGNGWFNSLGGSNYPAKSISRGLIDGSYLSGELQDPRYSNPSSDSQGYFVYQTATKCSIWAKLEIVPADQKIADPPYSTLTRGQAVGPETLPVKMNYAANMIP